MKQFVLKNQPDRDGFVRLEGEDYHYLARVRRLKKGGIFPAVNGNTQGTLTVVSSAAHVLTAVFSEAARKPDACSGVKEQVEIPPIILFQAMLRGSKADMIVRQAAEGALSEVAVFVSGRSVVKPEDGGRREERWRRIVKEARQQSGSLLDTKPVFFPSLDGVLSYWETLRKQRGALGLLLHPETLEQASFHDYLDKESGAVVLAAGPEGGFSGVEVRRFLDAGFRPVRMGGTVLRAETAALYGAAAVRIILLEKTAWALKENRI